MKVKVGDKVRVIAGSDKGKEGNVQKVLRKSNRVIVTGVNIVKKHMKPSRTNETGGILEVEGSIHASNVKILESSNRQRTKTEKIVKKAEAEKEKETKKAARQEMIASVKKQAENKVAKKEVAKKAVSKAAPKKTVTRKVGER